MCTTASFIAKCVRGSRSRELRGGAFRAALPCPAHTLSFQHHHPTLLTRISSALARPAATPPERRLHGCATRRRRPCERCGGWETSGPEERVQGEHRTLEWRDAITVIRSSSWA
ncbi:hypothetical protein MTP99_016123 [Tenebrio molitor]|nr:hypothetical protein MTP99_016123 [Tenebrio molitor]